MHRKPSSVIVSIATIPSRIACIESTLKSLLEGLLAPDLIVVCTPKYCKLENSGYVIPDFLTDRRYGDRIKHSEVDRDWGPGTKIIGPLSHFSPDEDELLVIADDDVIYHREFLSKLVLAQTDNRLTSSSFNAYRDYGVSIATGCDGLAIWTCDLSGIKDFAEKYVWDTSLLYHDDIWIGFFLTMKGVKLQSVRLPHDVSLMYTQNLPNDVLSAQTGNLKRELIASTHLPRLIRDVPMSKGLRLKLRAFHYVDLVLSDVKQVIDKARRITARL